MTFDLVMTRQGRRWACRLVYPHGRGVAALNLCWTRSGARWWARRTARGVDHRQVGRARRHIEEVRR